MNELKALYKVKDSNLPFVIYSDFGTKKINVLIQSNKELNFLDDFNKDKGFVFSPFEKNLNKILIKPDVQFSLVLDSSYKRKVISINDFLDIVVDNNLEGDKKLFLEKFNLCQENINKEIFEKVVISRKESISLNEKFDLIDNYIELVLKNPNSYNYLFYHPKVGIWIGSTPEVFLKEENNKIETNSIAGTKEKSNDWTDKEIIEQKYVTDYIIETFKEQGLEIDISKQESFSYGNIEHLKNIISAKKNTSLDINILINKLHPTPAVCGISKKNAYNFILTKEGYDREFYTGFLGFTSKKKKELYVNLRCMKLDLEKAYLYSGCGITKDSEFQKEWIETENKTKILKSIL